MGIEALRYLDIQKRCFAITQCEDEVYWRVSGVCAFVEQKADISIRRTKLVFPSL